MIKGLFIDGCLRLLAGGVYSKSDFKFERRDCALFLDAGLGYFIKANFFENYNLGEKGAVDPGFLTVFEDVEVKFNAARNVYYSDLPAAVLGTDGMGVYQVSPMQDESATFVPLQPATGGLYAGMPSEHLLGEAGARQEGSRVIYQNIDKLACGEVKSVLMKLICSTIPLSMEDELPLPIDYTSQVQEYVVKMMSGGMRQPDTQNDQHPSNR